MKRFFYLVLILVASIMTISFAACGGGDDSTSAGGSGSGGSGSGGGGSTPTANINIIGTWRAYYQRNGVQLYDLVSFNADHTGYVIEEVGNGTDNKNPITWTMTGNVITVKLDGDYVITWTILQVIDDNTVTISDGKRTYNVVRDGTGGGGSTPTATFNIIGTWRAYYQSKDTSRGEVYDLVTFNSDYTGTVIEEVGYGSDNPVSFIWKQTGNIIQVSYGGETITWTIQQIIDNNTVVVNDGKKDIKVYRDGTGGGDTPTVTIDIIGTWRAYYQSNSPSRGQVYDLVTFNADHTGSVIEEVGYGSDNSISLTWTLTGNVIQVKLDGDYVITWTIIQIIDDNTVIISDGKRNYNVVRDETGGGSTPVTTNPVLGTFSCVYQSYYDETPYDYYGGFVTIIEDPDNTSLKNAIIIKDLYLEGSAISGYYDLDQGMLYVEAWERIGNFVGNKQEYGFISLNWKDTDSDWIPFTINEDGSLTSDSFGVYALDADYANYLGWWEVATITTLTPTQSGSVRKMSSKISATTKKIKVNKVRLPNKRIRK